MNTAFCEILSDPAWLHIFSFVALAIGYQHAAAPDDCMFLITVLPNRSTRFSQGEMKAMSDQPLEPCSHRLTISSTSHKFFCRHTGVRINGNLVHAAICNGCQVRDQPCENPRPVPEPEELQQLPSKFRMVRSFAGSMAEFARDGFRLVDDEEYERRLSICQACKFFYKSRCMKCGCGLKRKARGRVFRCPIGKWREELDTEAD